MGFLVKVKISEVNALMQRIKEINDADLKDIQLIDENGKVVKFDPQVVAAFKYTGLNNITFIKDKIYSRKDLK